MNYIKYNTPEIEIPDKLVYCNDKNKCKDIDVLTSKGNLSTRKGKKSIKLIPIQDNKINVKNEGDLETTKETKKEVKQETKKEVKKDKETVKIANEFKKTEETIKKDNIEEKVKEEILKVDDNTFNETIKDEVKEEVNEYEKKIEKLQEDITKKIKDKMINTLELINSMMIYLNTGRKNHFKTDEQYKKYELMINAMVGFDFYPTPSKYGELIKQLTGCKNILSGCKILEAGSGLCSLSLPFILDGIEITLTELNNDFYNIIKPFGELPNVKLMKGNFLEMDFKDNDYTDIIMNPPFEAYIPGLDKSHKAGYHFFLLKANQILNNSKIGGEKTIYIICPFTDFKSSTYGNLSDKDIGEVCVYNPPQEILKQANKLYDLNLEEYEDKGKKKYEQPFFQIRFISFVEGFRKFAKNGKPTELKAKFGLFQIINNVSYKSEYHSGREEKKKMKQFIKGKGLRVPDKFVSSLIK